MINNIQFLDLLSDKGIVYNIKKNQWMDNGKITSEENILVFVIRALKALGCENAGERAESVLELARSSPETTFKSFLKSEMKKEYGKRTSGKEFFLRWLEMVEPASIDEIRGRNTREVGIWLRKKSGLLKRFYEAAHKAGINIRDIARIGIEGIFRHVFFGWRLIKYHNERDLKIKRHQDHQETEPPTEPDKIQNAWNRYEEFVRKLLER